MQDLSVTEEDYFGEDRILYLQGRGFINVSGVTGNNPQRFSMPDVMPDRSYLEVRLLPENQLGIIMNNTPLNDEENPDIYMCKIDRTGQILWEYNYDRSFDSPSHKLRYMLMYGLSPVATPFVMGIGMLIGIFEIEDRYSATIEEEEDLAEVICEWFPAILLAFLKLSLCAWIVFIHCRNRGYSPSSRIGWSMVAWLGGIVALLGLWIVLWEEKRIACPNCEKKRLPSHLTCPHCQTSWSLPETRDTDILPG